VALLARTIGFLSLGESHDFTDATPLLEAMARATSRVAGWALRNRLPLSVDRTHLQA